MGDFGLFPLFPVFIRLLRTDHILLFQLEKYAINVILILKYLIIYSLKKFIFPLVLKKKDIH